MNILDPQGPIGVADRAILIDSLAIMLAIVLLTIIAIFGFAYWFRASNTKAFYWPDWEYSGRIDRSSGDGRLALDHGEPEPEHDADGSVHADAAIRFLIVQIIRAGRGKIKSNLEDPRRKKRQCWNVGVNVSVAY